MNKPKYIVDVDNTTDLYMLVKRLFKHGKISKQKAKSIKGKINKGQYIQARTELARVTGGRYAWHK